MFQSVFQSQCICEWRLLWIFVRVLSVAPFTSSVQWQSNILEQPENFSWTGYTVKMFEHYSCVFMSCPLLCFSEELYEPSYYQLGDGETEVCLATGFSRHNATELDHDDLFNKTEAVRISEDSLYNEVALLSADDQKQCQSRKCEWFNMYDIWLNSF